MHRHETKTATFHHHGDYRGEVHIVTSRPDQTVLGQKRTLSAEVRIDMADLLEFVASYVRAQRVSALEDMSDEELLGLGKR